MSDYLERLNGAINQAEAEATPQTIVHSGGHPAPIVPNCIGPSRTGDCSEQWRIDPAIVPANEWPALERAHELTHAAPAQRHTLRNIAEDRAVLQRHHGDFPYDPDNGPGEYSWTLTCMACGGPLEECEWLLSIGRRYGITPEVTDD